MHLVYEHAAFACKARTSRLLWSSGGHACTALPDVRFQKTACLQVISGLGHRAQSPRLLLNHLADGRNA